MSINPMSVNPMSVNKTVLACLLLLCSVAPLHILGRADADTPAAPASPTAAAPPAAPEPDLTPDDLAHIHTDLLVPEVVNAVTSKGIPVLIKLTRDDGKPLPKTVYVQSDIGCFEGTTSAQITIPLNQLGFACPILFLRSQHPISATQSEWQDVGAWRRLTVISVFVSATVPRSLASRKVRIRQQDSITILKSSKSVPTDGRTTGSVTAVVRDQFSQGLPGVPCILVSLSPTGRDNQTLTSTGTTDADGMVRLTVPARSEDGLGVVQIITSGFASGTPVIRFTKPGLASP